ncbi:MAG: T9SS type A sorting domain-containing protein [Sphingobacteriales bacterium JAD_PAG50586_3]|nr:MAG: T9SS type A sorting domain-containing protein [Sphingobacteriales bacterium JAD_PAG50586_3]
MFVYYTDQFLNYWPGTVKRYFNNTWVTVGRQQIFNGITQSNSIRTNPATGLVTIGSLLQGFWGEGIGYYLKSLPCNFNTAIAGNVFYDVDSDCNYTVNEPMLPNTPILLTQGPNTSLTFTDNGGNYYFTAMPAGTYTIGTGALQSGYNIQCANSQPHTTVVTANALTTESFAVACTPSFDFIAASLQPIGAWWSGQYVSLFSNAPVQRTVCSGTPTPGTVTLVFPACLNFVADTMLQLQPTTVIDNANGDTIIYSMADVYNYPPYFFNSLLTRAQICTTATTGDTLCIQLIVSALNDNDPANNTYTRCIAIASSYDPNNKEVNPKGIGSSGIIPDTTGTMVYTINFQNTGDAPAVNIVIKDTLSSNLVLESFQIVTSSHAMQGTNVSNGVVSFNFPNIMLPDSTSDEVNSHGFVTYKIDLVPNLAPLTQIKNTAYIYFDYNEAIITNTAVNTIEEPLGISLTDAATPFAIYPNPAMYFVSVYTTANYKQAQLMIYNLTGQLITQKQITQANQIPITELGNGMYIFVVQNGDKVIGRQRVVVVR